MVDERLAEVIPLRVNQAPILDPQAAPGMLTAAREATGLTPARFAAELSRALGWRIRAEWVLRWEGGGFRPDVDVLIAAESLARAAAASRAPAHRGSVAGSVLRAAREGACLSAEDLAGCLGVDPETINGWESGREPLSHTKHATLRSLARRLRLLGVDSGQLARFDTALDVDLVVGQILADGGSGDPLQHPLATWVTTREWNALLGDALGGAAPAIGAGQREALFAGLRLAVERATGAGAESPRAVLLRRQVAYMLAAWDPASGEWLAAVHRRTRRTCRHDGWTPAWAAERSLAVSAAVGGDREALRGFIATRLSGSDALEDANLSYWAYWCGEGTGAATSDEFMAAGPGRWRGDRLLRHLAEGLDESTPYLELSVHAVWALLQRRPHLLQDDPGTTTELAARADRLLDNVTHAGLGQLAVKEISQVQYAIRMARGTR